MQIFFCKDNKFWRKTATQLRNFHANLSKSHFFSNFFATPMGDRGDRPLHKKNENSCHQRHPTNWLQ